MYRQLELNLSPEEILEYLRKSQSDDPNLSVEEVLQKHEKILDGMAEELLGGKVPLENRFYEVVSGETITGRPEIQKILRLIESPKYKAIMIVEPQRLTRGDLEDIGYMMKLLKHTNTLVITQTRVYDLRDEYDWDAFERELKRGNEYLEYYKKIQRRGKLLSISQGNYISSKPPYGFDKHTVLDGKRKCPTLKENKEQADVVRMIFELYTTSNMGRVSIARYLDKLHIKAPGGDHWSAATIKDMLQNHHYIGKVRWNWRQGRTIVEDGKFKKTRPRNNIEECLVFEGKHEGIISQELFDAAAERLGRNPRTKPEVKTHNPLAGLLYCSCGRSMTMTCRRDKNGVVIEAPRLSCPAQAICGTRSCTLEEMMDRVADILQNCIEDFELRIENNKSDSVKLHANLIKQLEAKAIELEKKEISQWEKYSEEDMPKHIFEKLNAKVLQEKEEVRLALCEAGKSMPEPVDYEEKLATFRDALEALKDPEEDGSKKNALLKNCIDRIEYSRERGVRLPIKATKFEPCWSHTPIELDVKLRV